MGRRILKYDLPNFGSCVLNVRLPARPLSVGYQHGILRIWIAVDEGGFDGAFPVHVVQTGDHLPEPPAAWRCIGRAEEANGTYVVHVFTGAEHG